MFFAELGVRTLTVPGRKNSSLRARRPNGPSSAPPWPSCMPGQGTGPEDRPPIRALNLESPSGRGPAPPVLLLLPVRRDPHRGLGNGELRKKCVMPVIAHSLTTLQTRLNLLLASNQSSGRSGFSEVSAPMASPRGACRLAQRPEEGLRQGDCGVEDPVVVLIGRPYVVLSPP